jgi:hypothetical protein
MTLRVSGSPRFVAVAAGWGDVVHGKGGKGGTLGVKSRRHEEREAKTPW